jgi:hypothetical protein
MLMLRKGGQFTDSQIRKYMAAALVCFAVAVVGILATRYTNLPLVGLIATALAITAFKKNFRRWSNWFVGKRGELAVTEALKSLPGDYILLNDLTLPDGRGNVDHLVIGPNGLFVIETKNYSGYVKCFRDTWYVNGREVSSLSKQAKRNAMAIKHNLDGVFAEHRNTVPFVNALLVFVKGNGKLKIKQPTIPVLRSSYLAPFIASYKAPKTYSATSPALTQAIVHHLQSLQQPSKVAVGG